MNHSFIFKYSYYFSNTQPGVFWPGGQEARRPGGWGARRPGCWEDRRPGGWEAGKLGC